MDDSVCTIGILFYFFSRLSSSFQIIEQVVRTATVSVVIPICWCKLIHSAEKNTSAVQSKVPMFSFWLRQLPSPSHPEHTHTHADAHKRTLFQHIAVDLLQFNSPQGQLAQYSSKTAQIITKSDTNTWRVCLW